MLGRTSGGIALRQRVGRRCKPAVGCRALGPRSSSAARRGILQGSSPGAGRTARPAGDAIFPFRSLQDPREASVSDSWDSGVEDGEQGNLPSCAMGRW